MLLTITTTHRPATDLGYLLHKNPARLQTFELSFGKAHIFYPQADNARCTFAMLVEVDPVHLVRKRGTGKNANFALDQYVNDRPYVASSFLSVALSQVLGSALSGTSRERPELTNTAIPIETKIDVIACRGEENLIQQLIEPLGYTIKTTRHALDDRFPSWGNSRNYTLELSHSLPLHEHLSHLYVLIPVLDNDKHYFDDEEEVEKLLRHGETWLANHPARQKIVDR